MDVEKFIKEIENRDTEYHKYRSQWFYNILIAACGFLGALIALSDNTESPHHIRLAFSIAIVLGTLGVLLLSFSLLHDTILAIRKKKEILQAWHEKRMFQSSDDPFVSVQPPTFLIVIGKISIVSLMLFLICTVYYVVAKNLP